MKKLFAQFQEVKAIKIKVDGCDKDISWTIG